MAEIVLRGRRYPALFDLQNVKELQEHFGDLKVVAEKLNDPEEAAYIIWLLVREGVELDNEEHHRDNEAPSLAVVKKLISFADLQGGLVASVEDAFMEFYGKNGSGAAGDEDDAERIWVDDVPERHLDGDRIINFARLQYIAVGLLGYTRRETRFLSLNELLEQFTEYCAMNGIELPQERGLADGDA